MSWVPLSFSVPIVSTLKLLSNMNPATYSKYEAAPTSPYENKVINIALKVLKAELDVNGEYADRIREMIKDLPTTVAQRDVESLVRTRLKVVNLGNEFKPVHLTGSDVDSKDKVGKYYLSIYSQKIIEEDQLFDNALPWIVAHEIKHFLNEDELNRFVCKTVASYTTCIISSLIMGCNFPAALVTSIAAVGINAITHSLLTRHFESHADEFAIRHSSHNESRNAVAWLQSEERTSSNPGFIQQILKNLHFRSSRIGDIEKSITAHQRKIA